MGLMANIRRDLRFVRGLRRLLKRIKPIQLDSPDLICDDFQDAVDKWPDNLAAQDEQRSVSYRELDMMANRYAHWAKSRNLRRSDTVALLMQNRIDYLACWLGLSKVGIATALLNTNLDGAALAHCINICGASQVITDHEGWGQVENARPHAGKSLMVWVLGLRAQDEASNRRGIDSAVRGASSVRPDRELRKGLTNRDTALYIFTSGTTGLPKAARIPHSRARTYMRAFAGATGSTEKDRLMNVLPLYHSTGGLCGVGSVLLNGGAVILRRRFSAGSFWPDVVESGATTFVYIGELCRYLVNSPPHPLERAHKLRLAFGNGLRPEIWSEFKSRFGIADILEFYGSTEGNVSTFNFDGRTGSIGRAPRWLRRQLNIRLVRFDLDSDLPARGANGRCIETRPGEIGEAIGQIKNDVRHDFSGYADKAASEKKILRDVFAQGDAWFRTGDLMRQDSDGYFYFVDRIGDTFRWKGENVSTSEVEERLAGAPGVSEVIAYGVSVPGHEGKAGMVTLVAEGRFGVKRFAEYVNEQLPPYARPVFVRVAKQLETTGTFKYRKVDLVADGFDPETLTDAVYVRDSKGGYAKLTPKAHAAILSGETRL